MKVLFLDIDGVCNSRRWFQANPKQNLVDLDPDAVTLVHALIAATGVEIVVSSTWRLVPELMAQIQARLPVRSRTPRGDAFGCRSDEIRAWLTSHPDVTTFAIVDDDPDAGYDDLAPHFVQTDGEVGLTSADVVRLVAILQGK